MDYQGAVHRAREHRANKENPNQPEFINRESTLANLGNRIDKIAPVADHDNPNVKIFAYEFPTNTDGDDIALTISAHYNYVTGSLRPRSATEITATWYSNGEAIEVESTESCRYQPNEMQVYTALARSVAVAEEAVGLITTPRTA